MIKLIKEDNFFEMATVHRDSEDNVSIAVNPDQGRISDPYFKFYNNSYLKYIKI